MHPFRFGVMLGAANRGEWIRQLQTAELLGYSIFTVSDHFGGRLAPIPALASACEHVGLRMGTLVLANDFRRPAVLAKEAATLDVLSGGRLELGLGAGWLRDDFVASGISMEEPGVRVDRLAEAIAILKGLWGEGRFSYEGRYYRVDLDGLPKPAQKPRPPILIAGGSRRILRLAGEEADIVGVSVPLPRGDRAQLDEGVISTTREMIEQKLGWLRAGAGERYDQLELNTLVFEAHVTGSADDILGQIGRQTGADPRIVKESPQVLVGTVDEICEQIEERRGTYGISYYTFYEKDMETMAPVVERLSGA